MCIVLFSTAHPDYALIAVDNRDEYVLRPTSRPHWWTHQPSGHRVLSARDLHRRERGTWLGLTKGGRFAVLTNYRESAADDPQPSSSGVRSRGEIVNAWLGCPAEDTLDDFVGKIVEDESLKGVGGFSLICGDLKERSPGGTAAQQNGHGAGGQVEGAEGDSGAQTRKNMQPLAIISNRSSSAASVPRICSSRGRTWGLSNAIYSDDPTWPKIRDGERLLDAAVESWKSDAKEDAADGKAKDEALADHLIASVLDDDKLSPYLRPDMQLVQFLDALRKSVLVPAFSTPQAKKEMAEAQEEGAQRGGKPQFYECEYDDHDNYDNDNGKMNNAGDGKHGKTNGQHGNSIEPQEGSFTRGAYGTQRQTVMLVDWDGNVMFKERALFDAWGNAIPKGEGDVVFRFSIDEHSP